VRRSIIAAASSRAAVDGDGHDVGAGYEKSFDLARFVRLSYATSEQNLREAVERIAEAF
jgi:hypothetical protein